MISLLQLINLGIFVVLMSQGMDTTQIKHTIQFVRNFTKRQKIYLHSFDRSFFNHNSWEQTFRSNCWYLSRRSRGWDRCGSLLWRYTIRFLTTFICRVRGHCTVSWQWWISGTSIKSKIHTCIQLTGQNINSFLEKKIVLLHIDLLHEQSGH